MARAVCACQSPLRRGRNPAACRACGFADEVLCVGHVAADERGVRGSAGGGGALQLSDCQIDGAFGRIPGRRVAHAQHADEPVESVVAMVHDLAGRPASHAGAVRRYRQQASMNQAQVADFQRQSRKRPVDGVHERLDLMPVEREAVHPAIVAVVARSHDGEFAPRRDEQKPAVRRAGNRVRSG